MYLDKTFSSVNIPYTYHLYWSKTKMHYYGVRWARNCCPNELWVTYFTSSNHVKKYVKSHGNPDIIEIRRTFLCNDDARLWEHRVLSRLAVSTRADYLNKTSGGRKFYSELHGQKNPMYGVNRSGNKNTFFGMKHSDESKMRMSRANLGNSFAKGCHRTDSQKQTLKIIARKRARQYVFSHPHNDDFVGSLLDLSEKFPNHNLRTDCLWQLAVGNFKTYKKWSIKYCIVDYKSKII